MDEARIPREARRRSTLNYSEIGKIVSITSAYFSVSRSSSDAARS
jgi:hypothetical protein